MELSDGPRPLLLKELIAQLRREIGEAVDQRLASGERPMFSLDSADLEVHFVIEQATEVEGSANSQLLAIVGLKAGAKKTYSDEQVQKVTLHLTALKESDGSAQILSLLTAPTAELSTGPDTDWRKRFGLGGINFVPIEICDVPGVNYPITVESLVKRVVDRACAAEQSKFPTISWKDLVGPEKQ